MLTTPFRHLPVRRLLAACCAAALLVGPGPIAASPGAVPPASAASERAVAVSAELSLKGDRTRLVLTLSRPVSVSTFLLERPDRVVIELPDVNFQLDDGTRRRLGLVSSFRCGLAAPGRSRIVVDLAGPAMVAATAVEEAPLSGATLVIVEFARADRDSFRKAVTSDRTDLTLTTGSLPSARTEDTRPLVAIDAGHGGTDPGAKAPNGVQEKDVTLVFAETLRAHLAASGRYRLLMTRDTDTFVSLDERVRRAREAGAGLFLSVHADTISNPHVSGATLYTGSEQASDPESATLAERENAADTAGGRAGSATALAVPDILQELTIRETRGFSHHVSSLMLRDLSSVMRFSSHPQREAGFRVLRTHDLPAVLVELGYLSNARDLDLMSSPRWRDRTAGTMAAVIDRFFAGRAGNRAAMSP